MHVGALTPLALLLWDGARNDLTVNPIQAITVRTGYPALVLLVLSLACTPVNRSLGWKRRSRCAGRWGCTPSSTPPCTC